MTLVTLRRGELSFSERKSLSRVSTSALARTGPRHSALYLNIGSKMIHYVYVSFAFIVHYFFLVQKTFTETYKLIEHLEIQNRPGGAF